MSRPSQTKFRAALAELKTLRQAEEKALLQEFYDDVNDVFIANPTLGGFRWRQYTPTFNDGSECVFTCTLDCADFWPVGYTIDDYDAGNIPQFPEAKALEDVFHNLAKDISDEEMEVMFKNNFEITIRRRTSPGSPVHVTSIMHYDPD
jgi:hypothetical protein